MSMKLTDSPILPGSTLGVFGSGQLGRMFAIAARRMGYRVHVFSPDKETPTGQVADLEVTADYNDAQAVQNFAQAVDVVTYEFENVPHQAVDLIENLAPVRPHKEALLVSQHRIREKEFLVAHGIPVTPFKKLTTESDLDTLNADDFPAIMKTASSGYDGKGQIKVENLDSVTDAWRKLDQQEVIIERVVDFTEELSVVGVRGADASFAHYGPILNRHENHILDLSILGAELPDAVSNEAVAIARSIMEELDVIGVICIEFFLSADGRLLVNEIAPRPHNSGHLTINAHVSCQFEQQVRTICGLPLGSTRSRGPAAMANLLGDLWEGGEPDWVSALSDGDIHLHLYGKHEARVGRKMGHLTVLANSAEEAARKAVEARLALTKKKVTA